jgi:hypothetical protein
LVIHFFLLTECGEFIFHSLRNFFSLFYFFTLDCLDFTSTIVHSCSKAERQRQRQRYRHNALTLLTCEWQT